MIKVEGTTITLTLEGREMIFQEKELVAILNEYFKIKKHSPQLKILTLR